MKQMVYNGGKSSYPIKKLLRMQIETQFFIQIEAKIFVNNLIQISEFFGSN